MFNFPLAPVRASTFADQYDILFYTILALTIFFTVVVGFFVVFFALRYRRGTKVNRANAHHENLPLEITWSVIPLILGVVIFWFGAKQFIYFKTPPKDSMEVYVVGKQWMWHIQHADSGVRENNTLHVPLGKDVKLTMISQDVIHAFYIPEFRFQYQVVPGRYTQAWFNATRLGTYRIFCNMFCGTQHSEMGGYVYVMTPKDYAAWIAHGGNDSQPETVAQRGAEVYQRMACANCHGQNDTLRAPSLYGIFGKRRSFADGSSAVADEAYLRESILTPYAHITAGYGNTMPEYGGQITEEDVLALIAYIKGLGQTSNTIDTQSKGPERGVPASTTVRTRPKTAAGALGAMDPVTPTPSKGNLAVGALGAQKGTGN